MYLRDINRHNAEDNANKTSVNADHSKQIAWQDQTVRSANDTLFERTFNRTENPLRKLKQLIVLQIGGGKESWIMGLRVSEISFNKNKIIKK